MKILAMVDSSVMYYIMPGANADPELFNPRTEFHTQTCAVAFCPVNQQLSTLVNEWASVGGICTTSV